MQSSLTVVTPAQDVSLVSLYEAKIGLNLASSTDTALDEQLELLIEWSSAEIAALCNRVFAQETVIETFQNIGSWNNRTYLSRYPVKEITAITEDDVVMTTDDYTLDKETGLLIRNGGAWSTPIAVSYTGGYSLPNDSPRALRNAAVLMTREAYHATTRGDSSIRMVAHKESRVIYFDPNSKSGSSGGSSSPARRAVADLLKHFTRFYI
jgi:hypothetical protein